MHLRGPSNHPAAAAREGQVRPQDDDRANDRRDPAVRREIPPAVGGRVVPEHRAHDEVAHGRSTNKRGSIPISFSLPRTDQSHQSAAGLATPRSAGEINAIGVGVGPSSAQRLLQPRRPARGRLRLRWQSGPLRWVGPGRQVQSLKDLLSRPSSRSRRRARRGGRRRDTGARPRERRAAEEALERTFTFIDQTMRRRERESVVDDCLARSTLHSGEIGRERGAAAPCLAGRVPRELLNPSTPSWSSSSADQGAVVRARASRSI
jgi:hypothetical protein